MRADKLRRYETKLMTETCADPPRFNYVYSCNLQHPFSIKVGILEGSRPPVSHAELLKDPALKFSGKYAEKCSDMYVECQLYSGGKKLCHSVRTAHKDFTSRWNWNEWISLPLRFCDLPQDTVICFTIYDYLGSSEEEIVGGTTLSVFGKHGLMRTGIFDLRVWPAVPGDGSVPTQTPGKVSSDDVEKGGEMLRLSKLVKQHGAGQIPKVDWLDCLAFREIEVINEREKRGSQAMYLMIEIPSVVVGDVSYSIIYYEPDGDELYPVRVSHEWIPILDPDVASENLVEKTHQKIARSLRSGLRDHDLKPDALIRKTLSDIVSYPLTRQLSSEEQDLIWLYRFYLTADKKALSKFLQCVPWQIPEACEQAFELLYKWSPVDPEDALEFLGPKYEGRKVVRTYAIARLTEANDEELLLYLLQLVQALKYEDFKVINTDFKSMNDLTSSSSSNLNMAGSSLTITDESLDRTDESDRATPEGSTEMEVRPSTPKAHLETEEETLAPPLPVDGLRTSASDFPSSMEATTMATSLILATNYTKDLASFLIFRASQNTKLSNFFYWYLLLECEDTQETSIDPASREMYKKVMKRFMKTLTRGDSSCRVRMSLLYRQQKFVNRLVELLKVTARESGNRKKKTDRLQSGLASPEAHKLCISTSDPLPFPLDPEIRITGVNPSKSLLFKSSLMPAKLTFSTTTGDEYIVIQKLGDDLRQDQLVLQMITLMDRLLRRDNLDLKLTPYRVLATSHKHGFVQFIESSAIADILHEEGSIQNFLRKHHPSESGPYGISAEVLGNYIRSCAGYSVLTYLLGIGDRHLDNLLMTTNGKLFHIDFGYMLGRDPKPLPPPMKLSKEMIEGMGGLNSDHYQEFKKQCYNAYLNLRRHANVILNLFALMVDASIPDIALEPDKVVNKVQDKFRLDLNDEEAVQFLQSTIDVSVSAVMPVFVERLHTIAQYLRRVGKTSLVHLMCTGEPVTKPSWTIGANVDVSLHMYKEGTPEQREVFMEFWDIGGCRAHRATRKMFYHNFHGIILVFDLTNRKTHQNLERWLKEAYHRDPFSSSGSGSLFSQPQRKPSIPGHNPSGTSGASWDLTFDSENMVGTQDVPILVVGTKQDQAPGDPRRERVFQSIDHLNADCLLLNTLSPRSLAPGSSQAVKLSRFFDRVIAKRLGESAALTMTSHQSRKISSGLSGLVIS
ncbi:unnamed protein product [Cyprideis torosa]|uniref:Phosphatidylinositol 3-kinase catalytic subunit type 3 n=1 Tax=Cyprideis torosa TaxID=163714 RepID=A0A7R8W827_9CRUS|nr:unnamed protein product [Cyprideis torosa]CAG0888172.1 unnamed protein product [Cyprideis torosa]